MINETMQIRTSKDTIEQFDVNKIKETLIKETKLDKSEAKSIAKEVKGVLEESGLEYITSPIIRELTNAELLKRGFEGLRNKHTRFGVTSHDIETLIGNGNKDNANMAQNPETIHKYVADEGMKEYTLLNLLPHKLSDAHLNGDLHCLSGRNNIIFKDKNGIHIERIDTFCEQERWKQHTIKVPSVNTENGKISWQKVVNGKKTGHKPCFEITFSKGLQIECTGDHKLFTYQSGKHEFGKEITPETYTGGQRIGTLNKIDYVGREDHYYYSALYGMFLGDGFYQTGKLNFHLKKQEKIDYVEFLLEKIGYEYHILKNKDDSIFLIVDSIVDFNKTKENLFQDGFTGNMKGLLEGLINSDGYITKHGTYDKPYLEFTNTNKELCDWFTISLMSIGLRPSFQTYINKSGNPYYKCVTSGDEITKILINLNLREPYKSIIEEYYEKNLIGGKLYEHTGLSINEIKPTGEKDVYNITVENNHNFLTGIRGFVLVSNCHDLEYFASRPLNCLEGKTPVIIKNNDTNSFDIVNIETLFEEKEKYSNFEVYTYNHKTEHGEFQPVNAVIKNPKTKLLKITFGSGQQITVSEDHEFYTYSNGNKKYKGHITENTVSARTLKNRLKTYKNKPTIAHLRSKGITTTTIDNKSKLIGFFLGDGGITDNQARFTLRKPDKITYLQNILNELGITYTVYSTPTKNNSVYNYEHQIVIKNKDINNELKNIWLNDKKLPETYITDKTVLGLLSGLISSDGYLTINNTSKKPFLEFKTTNKNIKKTFETCCFITGMNLVPHIQKRNGNKTSDIYNLIPNIYSSISLLKKMGLRKKQAEIIQNFEDEELIECSKIKILSIEEAGEDYVYTFNVHKNHNYLAGNGFVLNKNCLQHDLRLFIRYGLKVDGTGDHTSIAAPPTHMETVMNHSGEILLAAQQNMSGGQAFSLWNVFVAPFARGLPYERIKQCVEMFVFNLNMAYAARGGQVPFTSVGLEFTVPDFLKNEPAYGKGGKKCGVYGDYEKEVRLIQRAFTEVLTDGDANGKPHLFPNTIYYLREECLKPEFEEDIDRVHYLSAKFGTAYYINMLPDYMGKHANYMGSISGDTPLIYKKNGELIIGKASDFEQLCTDIDENLKTYYCRTDELDDCYEFLTYNEDGSKSWKKVQTIMKKEPSPLYHIRTKNGKELKITANHKIPVLTENKEIIQIKSEELEIGDMLYEYMEGVEYVNPNQKTKEDYFYELLGIFLADGYIKHEGNNKAGKNSNQLEFHFRKSNKIFYLTSLLDKLGMEYHERINKDQSHVIIVQVIGEWRKIFVNCYDEHTKMFPTYCLEDKRKTFNLLKGMLFDGTTTRNEQVYYSSNENLALGFMYGLSLLGIRYGFTKDYRKQWNPSYRICFDWNNKGYQPSKSVIKSIEILENESPVYDFEIEDNHNYVAGWGFIHIENCRTRLSDNWTGNWETDTLRCGNLAYVTLNLPRLAYKSKNETELFDLLDEQLENAKDILLIRRERAMKCLNDYKILPFLTQEFEGNKYYQVENSTLSFGYVGLNEMLMSMTGNGIADPSSNKLGHRIIDYINDKISTLKSETPYRWSIIQTPAESTAYRFATMDRKMYPDKVICNGDSSASYYTNSNHLPVDTPLSLPEKIQIESEYHPKTQGGHIFHAFMGESYSDPESLRSLTNKICHHSDIGFWAYSSALSYCNKCGTLMKGLQETCTHCGETREVEWYDRITGYVQQVGHSQSASSGWNAGKKQELIDRRRFEK